MSGKSILYEYSPKELQFLLDTSNGYSDVLRKVGLNPKGGNSKTLKKIINEYNLDEAQLKANRSRLFRECAKETNKGPKYSLEDILDGKHPNYQSSKLLLRLVEEGMKEYKCEICGISTWNSKPLSLQLHHKDGNRNNSCLNNLMILCPNCHSQTDNFAGRATRKHKKRKNKRKQNNICNDNKKTKEIFVPPVSRQELKDKIRTTPFVRIGKEYGVSDNAIRKWCDKYKLPRKVSDIKNIEDQDWENI